MATYQRETVEFLSVDLALTVNGTATPLTAADVADVELCVLPHGTRPVELDWAPATVLSAKLGILLDGALDPGIYLVWFRIGNHSPEIPVDTAGTVRIA